MTKELRKTTYPDKVFFPVSFCPVLVVKNSLLFNTSVSASWLIDRSIDRLSLSWQETGLHCHSFLLLHWHFFSFSVNETLQAHIFIHACWSIWGSAVAKLCQPAKVFNFTYGIPAPGIFLSNDMHNFHYHARSIKPVLSSPHQLSQLEELKISLIL